VPQLLARIATVQKGRLQDRVTGKGAVDPRRIDFTPGLALQILIAADVVSIGVGVVDSGEPPAVGIQNLLFTAVGSAENRPSEKFKKFDRKNAAK